MYKACLAASGLITYVCAAAVTQRRLENPVGGYVVCYKKLQIIIIIMFNYYYYYYYYYNFLVLTQRTPENFGNFRKRTHV